MENNGQTIDVKQIMEEIRREIKDKGYKNEDISFSDIPMSGSRSAMPYSDQFIKNFSALREQHSVIAKRTLVSNRVFGSLIIAVKKIIRKLMSFYIEPIVADQNAINSLSVACIVEMHLEMESMRNRIELLEKKNESLVNK